MRSRSVLPLVPFLCLLAIPSPSFSSSSSDLEAMQTLEGELQRESLALLAVFRAMAPAETREARILEMAKVVVDGAVVRDTREPDSRELVAARLNDAFEVLERDDLVLRVRLPDGRRGWIDEAAVTTYLDEVHMTNVDYHGLPDDQMRRYALLADEIFGRITEKKVAADELAAPHLAAADSDAGDVRDALLASYRKSLEYHGYAAYFHRRYVGDADLTLAAGAAWTRTLSAWGEVLAGKSSFATLYHGLPSDEVDESLLTLAFGGEMDVNPRTRVGAGFARRNEVSQTSYGTTDLDASWAFTPDDATSWRAEIRRHAFADDLNEFNDFQRTTLRLRNDTRRPGGAGHALDYSLSGNSYDNTEGDDYTAHALTARLRTGTRDRGATWRLRADMESSDAAYHDFTRLQPSVEWGPARGGTAWRALYENLSYGDAELRSYGRAELRMRRTGAEGPRRSETLLAVSRKAFSENELQTYVQIRGRLGSTLTGLEGGRRRLSFYTNLYTEASENSYTDLRLDTGRDTPGSFRSLALFGRFWHDAGSGNGAKAHVVDLNARLGAVRGNLRYGPSVGAHLLVVDDDGDFLERDGNLFRVGAFLEGFTPLGRDGRLSLNASYEYGFVWTDRTTIAGDGTVTTGETAQRHPTTFQVRADAFVPMGGDFDLSARLNLYRIATDMDAVFDDPAPGMVTDNERTTISVGVRYRYN